jgi:Cu(I)/Ag(I) efflux system membrane protein CusA/SilA
MSAQGITANIMSLSGIAIAIGAMVDASVVMVENAHRKLSDLPKTASRADKNAAILLSTKEVGSSSFLILPLINQSIKTGTTVIDRIAAKPIAYVFVNASGENKRYDCPVKAKTGIKFITLGLAMALLLSMAWPLAKTGSEFMPALYEGELLYMPTTMPGVSITKAKEILQQTNRIWDSPNCLPRRVF